MCGIAGIVSLDGAPVRDLGPRLRAMNARQRHRGPDGEGVWTSAGGRVGFGHVRLGIIDPSGSAQPMTLGGAHGGGNRDAGAAARLAVTFNGELYEWPELHRELGADRFRTRGDTEVLLHGHDRWGAALPSHLRGMFAYALWDETARALVLVRDRFGVKPLHWVVADGVLAFASEIPPLLAFLPSIDTDQDALAEYLRFQWTLGARTLFAGVSELRPGHLLEMKDGRVGVRRWAKEPQGLDLVTSEDAFVERTRAALDDAVRLEMRADVPVGAYLSGGLDSSVVATIARRHAADGTLDAFCGRFDEPGHDETRWARAAAGAAGIDLHEIGIGPRDFEDSIADVIRHLGHPVAGPGAFPQFVVAREARRRRKVLVGGLGGDEVFGGYVRYLVLYLEACLQGAIDGTMRSAQYVVTFESILPNLGALRGYEPLLAQFWSDGLFAARGERYLRLVDRSRGLESVIDWSALDAEAASARAAALFPPGQPGRDALLDRMTAFDQATLLPALLHVEDRMSMAHGLETRVPLLDGPLVDLVRSAPALVKFRGGALKHLLRRAAETIVPASIHARPDKMGFPVPLAAWARGPLRPFLMDVLGSRAARERPYLAPGFRPETVLDGTSAGARHLWAVLSLELWQREFHDRAGEWRLPSA